ncbi:MAG: TolC family protein [Phycisphaerales bacterium]|nr:TolC family protein [Phycisphaerales bacterium]
MTPTRTTRIVLALVVAAGLGGCASVTPDKRFPEVQSDTLVRVGGRVEWRQGTAADDFVDQRIAALLTQPLSADDAVQVALFNNAGLQATFEDLGIAQAEVVTAGQLRNPDIAGFFRFPSSPPSGLNWNIGIDVWLLDAFLVPVRQRLANASEDQTLRLVTQQVVRLAAETRAAYFALQADSAAVRAQEGLADVARLVLDLSRAQGAAGNVDDLRVAADRNAYQQAALSLLQARAAERASQERLRALMGLTDRPVTWSLVREAPAPTSGEPSEDDLLALALSSRLDVRAAEEEVQKQEYALELTKKWWLSTVQVGVETEKGTDGQYTTGPHFSAELPIFNQRQGEIARQEAVIRQVQRRRTALQGQARTEVRTALQRVAAAREVVEFHREEILPVRRATLAAVQDRYNSMFVGVFELLTTKSELTAAETGLARALQEYWTARSDLELAVGTRLPETPLPEPNPPAAESAPPPTPAPPSNPHQQLQPR